MRYHYVAIRTAKIKTIQMLGCKKLDLSYLASGNVKWDSLSGKYLSNFFKN